MDRSRYVDNLLRSFAYKKDALRVTAAVDRFFAELSLFTRGWSHKGEPTPGKGGNC